MPVGCVTTVQHYYIVTYVDSIIVCVYVAKHDVMPEVSEFL